MSDQLPQGYVLDQPDATALPQGYVLDDPAPASSPSYLGDMAASLGSGIARGVGELAMTPVTVPRMMQAGTDYVVNKGDDLIRAITGAGPRDPAKVAEAQAGRQAVNINQPLYNAQDAVRGAMDNTLYAPRTTPGKYAETVGEFAPAALMPSAAGRALPTIADRVGEAASNLISNAVVPGVASEAAGQATQGTAYEPAARIAGALAGNVGTALHAASNAPEAAIRRAVGDTPPDWAAAQALQNNRFGVSLTGPEAIAQASGGANALPNLQRVVEGSTEGRAATAPFFAARPGQVDQAVGGVLDQIAPQSQEPSKLGPRVSQAAERAIATSPEGQALTDAIFAAGPRTTAQQAGEVIQPALRGVYDRREGMRNATADQAYDAARRSDPTIPVSDLPVSRTVRQPGYTSLRPGEDEFGGQGMQPVAVPPVIETPNMTSRTGPDMIQADARPVLRTIDRLSVDAREGTANALGSARRMLYSNGGVDTSVSGLESARKQIGDQITEATRNGQMQAATRLQEVQQSLDEALSAVPEYARANDVFRAGSEPLRPFESPGMAATVNRDNFNRGFTAPTEQVPSALSSPSEAQNFNAVAPPEARTAFGNHLATTILDKATDGSGSVSPERLATVMRDNEDMLRQFPEVAQRLQATADAAGNMTGARVGPVGDLANAKGTGAATEALLPRNPMSGSRDETLNAITRVAAEDPQNTAGLARQALADRYSTASTQTQGGSRDYVGAKFAKDVAGNSNKRDALDAVLEGLNSPARSDASDLLQILEATGRRSPIGSNTSFNNAEQNTLGAGSPMGRVMDLVRSGGTSIVTKAGDAVNRARLRNSLGTLADLFTDPHSVELIQAAYGRRAPVGLAEALARTVASSGSTTRDRSN